MKLPSLRRALGFFIMLVVMGISFKANANAATLDDHLVMRLRFDGDVDADPESFFTGERNPSGIGYSTDSIDGSALDLTSGKLGYVAIFNPPEIEDNFTISLWMKLPEGAPKELRGIFSWGPEGGVEGEAHGFFVSAFYEFLTIQNFGSPRNSSRAPSVGNIDLTQWNHIAYTFEAPDIVGQPSSHFLFVNGNNVIKETSGLPLIVYRGNSLIIGANPIGGFEIFPGLIDDFRLYDKPLTQQEVKSLIDEFIPKISMERLNDGSILAIHNPRNQALEVLATSDFIQWDVVHVTSTSRSHEYFFDNSNQGSLARFYKMKP